MGSRSRAHMVPRVAVVVYLVKGNSKVLLRRRCSSHGDYTFALPGGHFEFGESFEECDARGMAIENIELMTMTNNASSDSHYVTVLVKATCVDPEKPPMNMGARRELWLGLDNLPQPLFTPSIKMVKAGLTPFSATV